MANPSVVITSNSLKIGSSSTLKLKQDLPCIRALNASDMRSRNFGNNDVIGAVDNRKTKANAHEENIARRFGCSQGINRLATAPESARMKIISSRLQ